MPCAALSEETESPDAVLPPFPELPAGGPGMNSKLFEYLP